ncbi:PepSY domain-containing protein [Ancylomarina euxinus]|uniref:PepSY domain-containing protein n=1 Tax=Ancylomarina euxinus TaxID=2283627 RepID=A0A425XWM7_9BACT|nr:PepSY-associated TM helix domain-containing protein [Ancylomarina euxinus]MCZ4696372.1 PepSY-associated TM helix domain-containing protein [Ancylomarina euxinus]MUP16779.1 iron-regulated protein [Ancylomarina euxinus]RRG19057.1 PepSY domain-containing protein [Ancylomarina euxinus]
MKNWTTFFKKHHKWPSLVLTLFILLFALSGIVMNHRETFSSIDVNREYLGGEYQYKNWNKAAVKSGLQLKGDTALIYGNVGVWKTSDNYKSFENFNQGFPEGIDNCKIEKLFKTSSGELYAGTLLGLYQFKNETWKKIELPVEEKRVVDLLEVKGNFYVLTRSNLLKQNSTGFEKVNLLAKADYDGKISLFKTLWEMHSGEAFGLLGKLFVDFIGLVFILLCLSGLIYFIYPKWIRRLKEKVIKDKGKSENHIKNRVKRKVIFLKFNLKWHNRLGYWMIIFLILSSLTGMFLRPPLLISIANAKVDKLPYTHLDDPNPWYDQLRRILYDKDLNRVLLASNEGIYYSDDFFETEPVSFPNQPAVSVMGVNVFEVVKPGQYLVGSFSGLFYWIPESALIFDYFTKKPHVSVKRMGPPISSYPIAGYLLDANGREFVFDYNLGVGNMTDANHFVNMPEQIQKAPMSLWNLCLEIHTGRIYQYIFGQFYILFIPLAGLTILWILITGLVLYLKRRKK